MAMSIEVNIQSVMVSDLWCILFKKLADSVNKFYVATSWGESHIMSSFLLALHDAAEQGVSLKNQQETVPLFTVWFQGFIKSSHFIP